MRVRYPESYEAHLYEAAHVRSNDNDEYKTTDILEAGRSVPGCMFSVEMLAHILCEKYQYHTPIDQIVEKLHHQGLKIPKSVIGERLHRAIEWLSSKLEAFWQAEVRRSWILMLDETRVLAMWFVDEFGRMFAIEHYCATRGLTGDARLVERLKPGNTADIMKRIEERLETFGKSDFAGCGQILKKALEYAIGECPAMKRVLECGDVELSNNLSEKMMRRIKMNLKNACNIGSEISAKHNAFMFSVIKGCKMIKRNVEDYLKVLFRRLRT